MPRTRHRNDDIYSAIMRLTGGDETGNDRPPAARTLYLGDRTGREVAADAALTVIAAGNDGMELWIGYRTRWSHHLHANEVRLLLRWLIVDWYIKARWLGLRRPIYYWALRRHIAAFRARRRHAGATR